MYNISRSKFTIFLLLITAMILQSCSENRMNNKEVENLVTEVKSEFAPDKRVALFEVEYDEKDGKYVLRGETNMPEAKEMLTRKLDSKDLEYVDNIRVLPDSSVAGETYGVISNSVANLRGDGKHSAELVTQAILGTPVKIWKRTKEWLYVQTPDGYLSWVDHGGITAMKKEEFEMWKSSEKVIYKNAYGQSYAEASASSKPVSDLVAGAILELEAEYPDYYKVRYPDGRAAFVLKEESAKYSDWLSQVKMEQESLVDTSEKLMGLPYLWGGTSSKGVDCSGFTKTIFFMNGMVIPRDASQQVKEGKLVDSVGNFDQLAVGDLLFFGRPATDSTAEKVVHVGMWLGNNEFIHASGDVHISSMDEKAENYDEFNKNRYLRTKRYLGEKSPGIAYLKNKDIYLKRRSGNLGN